MKMPSVHVNAIQHASSLWHSTSLTKEKLGNMRVMTKGGNRKTGKLCDVRPESVPDMERREMSYCGAETKCGSEPQGHEREERTMYYQGVIHLRVNTKKHTSGVILTYLQVFIKLHSTFKTKATFCLFASEEA